ncbi:extracellular glycosidase CRH11 [Musa acuminata AAA Group]|uniref:extracellular glycosidase CRH11 n=1 Tax=Musa acuminata AAA Group TaxID=214697 RepID=UPI0031D11391
MTLTMLGSGYHIRSIKCLLNNSRSPSKNVGKYQDILLISRCYSPKIPESVSRSRGKHYESWKWLGNVNGSLTAKQHPVRKLMGGKSLDTVKKKATTRNSSTSTITESSSSRKPLHNSSVLQANAATETSLSSCVMSKYQNLRPNSSFRGPRKTCDVKRVTSQVAGKVSSVAHISGKSSAGSSCSPGSIVQNVNTTKIQKNGMCKEKKKASGTVIRAHETRIKDVTQRVHHQNKAGDAKLVCQDSESKALGPAAPRKPLSQLNKSRPQKTGVVTIQRNFSLLGIKRILQCPIYVK